MTRRTLAALIGVLALLLAGCTPSGHRSPPMSGGQTGAPTVSPAPGAPNWTPCLDEAAALLTKVPAGVTYECATIKVPQDWTTPQDGKTFDLALIRVRSVHQSGRIGSLVVNPGGPGASGVDLAVYLSSGLPAEIMQRFDLVGFDPRGVGQSSPVKCLTDADEDAEFSADPDPVSAAAFNALVALDTKTANECQAKYGSALGLFSTEQAARDMDAIRLAVGDPKLTYLGYSYGTLLGATYAQLFPTHIRAFVLDGAVDPTQSSVASAQSQAAGFEHAFDQFAAWCQQQQTCPLAPDPRAAVNQALNKARTTPVRAADGRLVTAGWIETGLVEALYSQAEWSPLANAFGKLAQGDPTDILLLADEYAGRGQDGGYSNMFDIFNTVECDDDNSDETVAGVRALQAQWRAKYPLFGPALAVGLLSCVVWPAKPDPYPTAAAHGAPPIVVVGTTNDPATPYQQTAKLANMLGVGHVVTWQGQGHTAYPQTTCIKQAIDAYLIKLTVPPTGLTCPPN